MNLWQALYKTSFLLQLILTVCAKYVVTRFLLTYSLMINILNFASRIHRDWKQRRKMNQSMPKATLRGAHGEKDKSASRPPRGIESWRT